MISKNGIQPKVRDKFDSVYTDKDSVDADILRRKR